MQCAESYILVKTERQTDREDRQIERQETETKKERERETGEKGRQRKDVNEKSA